MNSLTGINLFPANRFHPIRKRKQAIRIGGDYYVHPKLYKRLCKYSRKGRDLRPLLEGIRVKFSLPKIDVQMTVPEPSFISRDYGWYQ